jgi:hypothetical protein
MHKVLLSDVLRYVRGRFDKVIGMIDCKPPLEFVILGPKALVGGVELSVVWMTDEEFDEHASILHGIWVVIQSVLEVDLDEFPFDVVGIRRRVGCKEKFILALDKFEKGCLFIERFWFWFFLQKGIDGSGLNRWWDIEKAEGASQCVLGVYTRGWMEYLVIDSVRDVRIFYFVTDTCSSELVV